MPQTDPQTEVECANAALSVIKAGRLVSLDDSAGDKAIIVQKWFAKTRDALQRRYHWNFNEDYAELPEGGDAVPAGFDFAHRFPFNPNMLGVREVKGCGKSDWKVQGRAILANQTGPLKAVVSVRISEVRLWDPLFTAAFIAALAYAIAPEAAKDDETIERARLAAARALDDAQVVDAGEGSPDEPGEQDIILARH